MDSAILIEPVFPEKKLMLMKLESKSKHAEYKQFEFLCKEVDLNVVE